MLNTLNKLARRLYPKGRAFWMKNDSDLYKMHDGISAFMQDIITDADAVTAAMLPDNDGFTATDAAEWERRLGISSSSAVPLADRKAAILRKYAHPGTVKPRQNYRYIQAQLRAAGFDVYVYENRFDDGMGGLTTQTPGQVLGSVPAGEAIYGNLNYGDANYGQTWADTDITIVANDIDEAVDAVFTIGPVLVFTFFVAGATIDTFANVDADRKNEFRQLLLTLKPQHTTGYLFVNYV